MNYGRCNSIEVSSISFMSAIKYKQKLIYTTDISFEIQQ